MFYQWDQRQFSWWHDIVYSILLIRWWAADLVDQVVRGISISPPTLNNFDEGGVSVDVHVTVLHRTLGVVFLVGTQQDFYRSLRTRQMDGEALGGRTWWDVALIIRISKLNQTTDWWEQAKYNANNAILKGCISDSRPKHQWSRSSDLSSRSASCPPVFWRPAYGAGS